MYYPCSENKGADQLCSYMYFTADLRLCFHIGNNPGFSRRGSFYYGFSWVFYLSTCCMKNTAIFPSLQVESQEHDMDPTSL